MRKGDLNKRRSGGRAQRSTGDLHLDLFSLFRLNQGDQAVAGFEHARFQHLLAYLALHRASPTSRRQLAFLFWPESTDQHAIKNLRTSRGRLRRMLLEVDDLIEERREYGRYSLEPAIGLSIALYQGMGNFEALLDGAHTVDKHFRSTPFEKNLAVVMALLGIWYTHFFKAQPFIILPCDQYLVHFPSYFQQGNMESNGKCVARGGQSIRCYTTGQLIWGQLSANGQHVIYQLNHQSTKLIPCDFLVSGPSHNPRGDYPPVLPSIDQAQTEPLMKGKTPEKAPAELASKIPSGMSTPLTNWAWRLADSSPR